MKDNLSKEWICVYARNGSGMQDIMKFLARVAKALHLCKWTALNASRIQSFRSRKRTMQRVMFIV